MSLGGLHNETMGMQTMIFTMVALIFSIQVHLMIHFNLISIHIMSINVKGNTGQHTKKMFKSTSQIVLAPNSCTLTVYSHCKQTLFLACRSQNITALVS